VQIEAIKDQMLALIIITMSVILILTNLVILAIIPRRYDDPDKLTEI